MVSTTRKEGRNKRRYLEDLLREHGEELLYGIRLQVRRLDDQVDGVGNNLLRDLVSRLCACVRESFE